MNILKLIHFFKKDRNYAFREITDGKFEELKKIIKVQSRDRKTKIVYKFIYNNIKCE